MLVVRVMAMWSSLLQPVDTQVWVWLVVGLGLGLGLRIQGVSGWSLI